MAKSGFSAVGRPKSDRLLEIMVQLNKSKELIVQIFSPLEFQPLNLAIVSVVKILSIEPKKLL